MATRDAIVGVFNRLVTTTGNFRPPVSELLKIARVARSTFYQHFDDRNALLLEAMGGLLATIADEVTQPEGGHRLTALLYHLWEQRNGGRELLHGQFAQRVVRGLADFILERAPELARNDAIRIADTQIAFVRLWLSGETPDTAENLSKRMIASARAQRSAFGHGDDYRSGR